MPLLSWLHPLSKGRGLLPKVFNRLFRVNGLRGIHSDKADLFRYAIDLHNDGISIYHTGAQVEVLGKKDGW